MSGPKLASFRSRGHTGKPHQTHKSSHFFTTDQLATSPQKCVYPTSTKKWSLGVMLIDKLIDM